MNSMATVMGAAFVFFCLLFWGNEKTKKEKKKLVVIEGLYSFVSYTSEQIKLFKAPLSHIYKSFTNEELENTGFLQCLCDNGWESACERISVYLTKETESDMKTFFQGIGAGYCESQISLCAMTLSCLERQIDSMRSTLPSKLKMYRVLPILLALSVIILLI